MLFDSISAWNSTVSSSAQVSNLSNTLTTIYGLVFIAMSIWLFLGLFQSWSNGKMKGFDAVIMVCRNLALMIFTFYLFA